MKYKILFLILLGSNLFSQTTAKELLDKIDKAQKNFSSMSFTAEMEILSRGRTLTKSFTGSMHTNGQKAYMEYTNPQDKGTRYLKLDQDMWVYFPNAEDVLKLSGHLLRDGMMGSDISYNDLMDSGTYDQKYNPTGYVKTNVNGKDSYTITLIAKNDTVTYSRLDLTVDSQSYVIYSMLCYAKGRDGDRAIKEFTMTDYRKVSGIDFSMKNEVRDLRKKDSKTIVQYKDVKINPSIDPKIFTRNYLEH